VSLGRYTRAFAALAKGRWQKYNSRASKKAVGNFRTNPDRAGDPQTSKAALVIALVTITAVFMAMLLEIAAYFIIQVNGMNFYLPLALSGSPERFDREKAMRTFSYELGWEPEWPNPTGYRGEAKDIDKAVLAVFGDSFTRAHPNIVDSWPHLLEQHLGRPVLNFGVGGYGTDQAYLRFRERYLGIIDTPYVTLLVMSENIARTVIRYSGFYMRKRYLNATKPRFIIDDAGNVQFLPNPVTSVDEMPRLWDENFLREIGQQDYWYHYFAKHDLNHKVGFPYSYYLLKALPFYIERGYKQRIRNHKAYGDLYQQEQATAVMTFILESFITDSEASGSIPIIYFLPNWKDLIDYKDSGQTIYNDYINMLRKERGIEIRDALEYFAPLLDDGEEVSSFFISRLDGHYGPRGEQVIADGIYAELLGIDQDKGLLQ
jgi:hypothetical protein